MSKRTKRARTLIKKMTMLGEKLSPEILKRYGIEKFAPKNKMEPEPAVIEETVPEPELTPEPVAEPEPELTPEPVAEPEPEAVLEKEVRAPKPKLAVKKTPAKKTAPKKRRAKKATPKTKE
tara:strand:- start:22493 stop:22855 length:363 start_codon:yes stop_codon:yes gene_type:complete